MKKNVFLHSLSLLLLFASCCQLIAQSPEDALFKTYSGGAGKCYGRSMINYGFDTIEEKVIIRPAYSYLKEVPPVFETKTERVLVKPAHTRIEVVPPQFSTITERVKVKDAESYVKAENPVPVQQLFETETITIETSPAYQTWRKTKRKKNCKSDNPNDCLEWELVDVPAQKTTIQRKVRKDVQYPVTEAPTVSSPAEYITITKSTLVKGGSYKEVKVPAQYQTITRKILIEPRRFERVQVPAEYKIVNKLVPIKDGGFMEAVEVVCKEEYPQYLRNIQRKLVALGYYEGRVDGVLGKSTKDAITRYQADRRLPIGQLDYSTLKSLDLVK